MKHRVSILADSLLTRRLVKGLTEPLFRQSPRPYPSLNATLTTSLFICLSTILVIGLSAHLPLRGEQEKLTYEVSVNVKLIPVFALDAKGNPVPDLTKEDLRLQVNGQPVKIAHFRRYRFETSKIQEKKTAPNIDERVVFIIIDSMFTSKTGYRRSKEIAARLVKKGVPTDHFILFENTMNGGLRYVGNSGGSRAYLLKKIAKLQQPVERWATQLYSSSPVNNNIDFTLLTEARLETQSWRSLRELNLGAEKMRYRYHLKHFSRSVARFKYILKTISKPKLVFLISEGIASGAFKEDMISRMEDPYSSVPLTSFERTAQRFGTALLDDHTDYSQIKPIYSPYFLKYLTEVVKSINYGGSVLYTINPERFKDNYDASQSGEMSLRFLAGESGGGYFSGAGVADITKQIHQATSTYYELVFYIAPQWPEKFQVAIDCKRKGVRVKTLNHAEGDRAYNSMEQVQKKMFALNIVRGGNWSRSAGKVMKVVYKKNKETKKHVFILVPLPKVMKHRPLDMYLIRENRDTGQVDMSVAHKKAKDWVKVKIKKEPRQNQYFVFIDPSQTHCIYNQIRL